MTKPWKVEVLAKTPGAPTVGKWIETHPLTYTEAKRFADSMENMGHQVRLVEIAPVVELHG